MLKAGVGDHRVESPESLERGGDGIAVALARGQVALEGQPRTAAIGSYVSGQHPHAVVHQASCDRGSDPARSAGDERNASCKRGGLVGQRP